MPATSSENPYYFRLERNLLWLWVNVAQMGVFYLVGFLAGWLSTGSVMGGVQFGLSVLVWGVFVRTVAVWHITWSVNSVTHMWGYRNYDTDENSKNNWIVGLVSNGEAGTTIIMPTSVAPPMAIAGGNST